MLFDISHVGQLTSVLARKRSVSLHCVIKHISNTHFPSANPCAICKFYFAAIRKLGITIRDLHRIARSVLNQSWCSAMNVSLWIMLNFACDGGKTQKLQLLEGGRKDWLKR